MKKVIAEGTKYLFGLFGIAILGLLMSLTYQALGRIFPTSPTNQMWGLVLFDIAAITWALAFVFSCETTGQYAVAIIGFLTGFIGTLIMVGAEVMLGQTLTTTNSTEIGRWLIYGFIGATILHATLVYAHHYNGQAIRQKVEIGIARGEVTTEAIKQANTFLDIEKTNLARTIADGIIADTKRELGLYPIDGTPFDRRQESRTLSLDIPSPTTDAIAAELPKYNHMRPPNGDRQHPDLLLNRLPLGVWQRILQEWEAHDDAIRAGATQEAGNQPSPFRGQPPE